MTKLKEFIKSKYQDSNVTRLRASGQLPPEALPQDVPRAQITYEEDSKCFNVYLTDVIEGPEHYTNVFDVFVQAKEDETIRVFICTPGGRLDTTNKIRGLAELTQAQTIGIIGDCASAGTVLALSFDDIQVLPNIEFMIHNYSSGIGGKGHEIYDQVAFMQKEMPKVFHNYYKDFLTEEECDVVISGKDLYLNSAEVKERWENVQKVREAEGAKLAQEALNLQLEEAKEFIKNNTAKPEGSAGTATGIDDKLSQRELDSLVGFDPNEGKAKFMLSLEDIQDYFDDYRDCEVELPKWADDGVTSSDISYRVNVPAILQGLVDKYLDNTNDNESLELEDMLFKEVQSKLKELKLHKEVK